MNKYIVHLRMPVACEYLKIEVEAWYPEQAAELALKYPDLYNLPREEADEYEGDMQLNDVESKENYMEENLLDSENEDEYAAEGIHVLDPFLYDQVETIKERVREVFPDRVPTDGLHLTVIAAASHEYWRIETAKKQGFAA
jgi:hypothetical protein